MITIPYQSNELHAQLYKSSQNTDARGCIFYLHGGGLIFGSMQDLPQFYIDLFLAAGYDLVSLDYPLAPESGITEILDAVHTSVTYFLTHPQELGYTKMPDYYLFGRSAGAYLALMEAKKLVYSEFIGPKRLIAFYGYHTFDLPEFEKPSAAWLKQQKVLPEDVARICTDAFLTEGSTDRFLIYLYARQNGNWKSFLGDQDALAGCCLKEEDFVLLPPGFFTAGSSDQDVPFRESKQMARKISGSKFIPVYYADHDFDRDITKKDGPEIYKALITWLGESV